MIHYTNKKSMAQASMILISLALLLGIFFFPAAHARASSEIIIDLSGTLSTDTGYTVSGSTVTLAGGYDYRLTGSTSAYTIVVPSGSFNITLENAGIDAVPLGKAAIYLNSGAAANLTIEGDNTLLSGDLYAGINVEAGRTLVITDTSTGKLTATGGTIGAGIGGGYNKAGGTITINGGQIVANGGCDGAGIGGGYRASGGTITITGGEVTAQGGGDAAGIGAGDGFAASPLPSGGNITISGGSVLAKGGNSGAGIGGGMSGSGGVILITGGDITAQGGDDAAGIGSGDGFFNAGNAGSIAISGGNVFAQRGSGAVNDIGNGYKGSGGTLEISGTAAVFLRNNSCITPTTATHTHMGVTSVSSGKLFGVTVPHGWTTAGSYIIPITVTYDLNGGAGTLPSSKTQHINTTVTVPESRFITTGDQYAAEWNTQADGGGSAYSYGSTFTFTEDSTLYASDWTDIVHVTGVTLGSAAETIEDNGTMTLTETVLPADATYPEITWTSSDSAVLSVDQTGKITGMDGGFATITATAEGKSDTCVVQVNPVDGGTYDIGKYGNSTTITIGAGYTVTLTNMGGTTYTNMKIVCEAGAALTIDGVKINDSGNANACALSFTGTGNTLILVGNSTLSSGYYEPGIRVEGSTALEIKGTGSINVTGGARGAGIGSGSESDGGSITISGGTVTATGGPVDTYGSAGIGGGYKGNGGNITITGGTVTAKSQIWGAGIGSGDGLGRQLTGGNITITGGTVTATGGSGCAGIGGGYNSSSGTIMITGGTVTATGSNGAGIGTGSNYTGGNITITGGTIKANGYGYAGIGGTTCTVTIAGGDITAGNNYGAGIGGASCTVLITDGNITATGGSSGVGIGGASCNVTLEGGDITAKGGNNGAGIGGASCNVAITGGDITATGGYSGAGIGGGYTEIAGVITIEGGTIEAIGGNYGAGIGSGNSGTGGTVNISGGDVYAVMGAEGQHDIGDGKYASGCTLGISGTAMILLKNDNCITASTTTHTRLAAVAVSDGKVYGAPVPDGWTTAGAYIIARTLTYDSNGSSEVPPQSQIQLTNTTGTITSGTLSRERYTFGGWNTKADGSGTAYSGGDTVTFDADTTLYAVWNKIPVTGVNITESAVTLDKGETYTLTAVVAPSNATVYTATWASSDTSVATVDSSGMVTAVGRGSATITATADGKADTCTVTVNVHVSQVDINKTSITIYKGKTYTLTATASPDDASDPEVTWTSSDTSVATVNSNGRVTAVGRGSATITATADGQSAECVVTVKVAEAAPTETPSPTAAPEPTVTPAPAETTSPAPSATPVTVSAQIIEENTDTGETVIEISVDDLPAGTTSIQLLGGEVVKVDGTGIIRITVSTEDISAGGEISIVALDDEGTPLGAVGVQLQNSQPIPIPDAASAWDSIWPVLMWILIGILGIGGAAALYFILRKKNA